MIVGYNEGYLDCEIKTHSVKLPTQAAGLLFIALAVGVDQAREEEYRYTYTPKKYGKIGCEVLISDVGE